MKTGIELIAIERQEQIEKHGRTVEGDVLENTEYQLVSAASRMLFTPDDAGFDLMEHDAFIPKGWDRGTWLKMIKKTYNERLIIAGALITAEIDRLQALSQLTELK